MIRLQQGSGWRAPRGLPFFTAGAGFTRMPISFQRASAHLYPTPCTPISIIHFFHVPSLFSS